MDQSQAAILIIIAVSVLAFLWGRWRHDMVAVATLLACVAIGLVPGDEAFSGFGHPAVVTVACVLILSRVLQMSGAIDGLTRGLLPQHAGPTMTIAALTGLGAVLSAFMNNVGALALLMPVAVQISKKQKLPPGRVLMPLAFGSILGGMTTLIGTPPNLIVSGFRAETGAGSFAMFDFTPVGLAVAAAGVAFVALVGWRLVPSRQRPGVEGFDIGAYLTEVVIPEGSRTVGLRVSEISEELDQDGQVVGMSRNDFRVNSPNRGRMLEAGDVLIIEAEPELLPRILSQFELKLPADVALEPAGATGDQRADGHPGVGHGQTTDGAGDVSETLLEHADAARGEVPAGEGPQKPPPESAGANEAGNGEDSKKAGGKSRRHGKKVDIGEVILTELVVRPDASLVGRSAAELQLRTRFSINLLALGRKGEELLRRLRSVPLRAGDVLLMQGPPDAIMSFAQSYGCVPLAERELRIPDRRRAWLSALIMAAVVGGAALGLVPAAISFAAGVLACLALRVTSPRTVYDAIDWPVIVLLAALIPVAGAMASTGAADVVAGLLLEHIARGHAVIGLALILMVSMTLSDFMNNAATAAVMCPVAISAALQLDARPDPFLMAVAIGSSCAFLTPIGHQNNTLILGPGGFHFGDYWRLGLPLEILVVAISVPMLLLVWPL